MQRLLMEYHALCYTEGALDLDQLISGSLPIGIGHWALANVLDALICYGFFELDSENTLALRVSCFGTPLEFSLRDSRGSADNKFNLVLKIKTDRNIFVASKYFTKLGPVVTIDERINARGILHALNLLDRYFQRPNRWTPRHLVSPWHRLAEELPETLC